MDKEDKFRELDPTKILEDMKEEYWAALSEPEEEVVEERVQVLLAQVGNERFSMEAVLCKSISKFGHVTRVPRMPGYILGVINLRGQIISVVDLGLLLGMEKTKPGPKSKLVVAQSGDVRSAFLLDLVLGIEWIELSRIQEPQAVTSTLKDEYIKGHISPRADESWITYLDVGKMIEGSETSLSKR